MSYWLNVIGWLIGLGYLFFTILQISKSDEYWDMFKRVPRIKFLTNFVLEKGISETLFMFVRLIIMSIVVFIIWKTLISI